MNRGLGWPGMFIQETLPRSFFQARRSELHPMFENEAKPLISEKLGLKEKSCLLFSVSLELVNHSLKRDPRKI
ncbi:hypothetical protein ACEQPO_13795 [Bacillus sp. SL00103]